MDTSKRLPFWLRRVDTVVAGRAAVETKVVLNGRAITKGISGLALVAAALFLIGHQVQRAYAVRDEITTARAQCGQLFENAEKVIGGRHSVNLSVGAVSVERFVDRDNGPDTMNCRADVKAGPAGDQWFATGHPGEAFSLVSARLIGAEMVDEFAQHK